MSIIVEGMPDDAVIEHEPGTVGRQINRRKVFEKRKTNEKSAANSVKSHLNDESRWHCIAFDNAEIYHEHN